MSTSIFLITIIVTFICLDLYTYSGINRLIKEVKSLSSRKTIRAILGSLSLLKIISIVGLIIIFGFNYREFRGMAAVFLSILCLTLIPQIFYVVVLIIEDIFRSGEGIQRKFWLPQAQTQEAAPNKFIPGRRKFVSQIGLGIAAIPFFSILHGVTRGKYAFTVRNIQLSLVDLPDAFDGFKITQLSDIHSGSFDDAEKVAKGVRLANEQGSDLIVFTGDLVNNRADEVEPWIDTFKSLEAPYGKFSILGNHDYGDYVSWPSQAEKTANFKRLKENHRKMGFNLLLNENRVLEKDGEKIALIGVENWGKPPFPQYGDINKALEGVEEAPVKVLLSHDPSHWDQQVIPHNQKIHLTLSGHTHGMQFGIEIPGIKWSPVKYRYPRWAGLYEEAEQYLYVNRGFGFLGFPGRVGIWPEVTVIELKKA